MRRILVAGVRATGDGYPNADRTLQILREHGVAEVVDLGSALPTGLHLWRVSHLRVTAKLWFLLRLLVGNIHSLASVLARHRRGDVVYVPYPAVFFLAFTAWLPGWCRPRCIADAYISLWDADANDRRNTRAGRGRLLRRMECMALRRAWRVMVDTRANREFLIAQLGLEASRVHSLPLAVDAAPFVATRSQRGDAATMDVVFAGTFIPLHGVDVILEAARMLRGDDRIQFTIIGDGQLAPALQATIAEAERFNLAWRRGWLPLTDLAAVVARADVCLGVFGGHGKASRVLPFKVYYALAAGKPVVTQSLMSLPDGLPPLPCIAVGGDDTQERARRLADAVLRLAAEPALRTRLSEEAAGYFDAWLGPAAIAGYWRRMLAQP